jgi:AcrR family transcriptional regulator
VARTTPTKTRARERARAVAPAGGNTRARLLATARDLFLEQGASAFSLREVARRVGISAAAVYRHFEDKDALLYAACTQGFQVFFSYLVRALAAPTAAERLAACGEHYRAFAVENPLDYRFMFMTPGAQIAPKGKPRLPAPGGPPPQEATFRFLVDRVSECISAGVLAPADPELVAVDIWSHVHGLVSLRLAGHLGALGDEAAFSQFYRQSMAHLVGSLGS